MQIIFDIKIPLIKRNITVWEKIKIIWRNLHVEKKHFFHISGTIIVKAEVMYELKSIFTVILTESPYEKKRTEAQERMFHK